MTGHDLRNNTTGVIRSLAPDHEAGIRHLMAHGGLSDSQRIRMQYLLAWSRTKSARQVSVELGVSRSVVLRVVNLYLSHPADRPIEEFVRHRWRGRGSPGKRSARDKLVSATEENPGASVRQLARLSGMSPGHVSRVLAQEGGAPELTATITVNILDTASEHPYWSSRMIAKHLSLSSWVVADVLHRGARTRARGRKKARPEKPDLARIGLPKVC